MTDISELHLFVSGGNYAIAGSAEDARTVAWEHQGGDIEDIAPADEWINYTDEHQVGIWCDIDLIPDEPDADGAHPVTMAACQWIKLRGRGFLASENI